MFDKNLFLYDLAVVAIMKDEGHYLKEWLDYHLLAGVNHFYLYDNDSTDNQAEVAAPYVEAGLVDYFYLPGKAMQYVAYNDAIKNFKFQSRYMAIIDGDEFIYPKTNKNIVEVVDEILSQDKNAAGLAINWHCFGSNDQDKADYSRGVLERFTRRALNDWFLGTPNDVKGGNVFIKSIVNPRRVDYLSDPHYANYFKEFYAVTELGTKISGGLSYPSAKKIVVNHYYTKSREEFTFKKAPRGWACPGKVPYSDEQFKLYDRNDEFDDGILKYRAVRAKNFSLESNEQRFNRVVEALIETLDTKISLETALTCRALSIYLREKTSDDDFRICEEISLAAIINSLDKLNLIETKLLLREMPSILKNGG